MLCLVFHSPPWSNEVDTCWGQHSILVIAVLFMQSFHTIHLATQPARTITIWVQDGNIPLFMVRWSVQDNVFLFEYILGMSQIEVPFSPL